jgi:zinc transporter 1/2/3
MAAGVKGSVSLFLLSLLCVATHLPLANSRPVFELAQTDVMMPHLSVEYGRMLSDISAAPAPAPEASVNLRSSGLISSKGSSMVVFFFVPFIGAMMTYFVIINDTVLRLGLLFSAGLFFAMGVMHLTGDAVAGLGDLTPDPYPYALLLVVSGFFVAWFADVTVHAIWERKAEREARQTSEKLMETEKLSCCKVSSENAVKTSKCSGVDCSCDGNSCKCAASSLHLELGEEAMKAGSAVEAQLAMGVDRSVHTLNELPLVELLFLLLALCFHGVFEGLAVGLTNSSYSCWDLTLTIVLHKFFEGSALGSALKQQNRSRPWWSYVVYASIFSIMAPIGIAIGIILDSTVEPVSAAWVEAIGNGFAAGVFIFVAVCHLMQKGAKKRATDKWWTPYVLWLFTALGGAVFACLELRES